jgi:hypothetical protein
MTHIFTYTLTLALLFIIVFDRQSEFDVFFENIRLCCQTRAVIALKAIVEKRLEGMALFSPVIQMQQHTLLSTHSCHTHNPIVRAGARDRLPLYLLGAIVSAVLLEPSSTATSRSRTVMFQHLMRRHYKLYKLVFSWSDALQLVESHCTRNKISADERKMPLHSRSHSHTLALTHTHLSHSHTHMHLVQERRISVRQRRSENT